MTETQRITKAAAELAIDDNGKPCIFTAKDVLRRAGYSLAVCDKHPHGSAVRQILIKAGYAALGKNHYKLMTPAEP